jgi:hypothetical protein
MIDFATIINSSRREGTTALDDGFGTAAFCKTIPLLSTETPSEQPKSIVLPSSLPQSAPARGPAPTLAKRNS